MLAINCKYTGDLTALKETRSTVSHIHPALKTPVNPFDSAPPPFPTVLCLLLLAAMLFPTWFCKPCKYIGLFERRCLCKSSWLAWVVSSLSPLPHWTVLEASFALQLILIRAVIKPGNPLRADSMCFLSSIPRTVYHTGSQEESIPMHSNSEASEKFVLPVLIALLESSVFSAPLLCLSHLCLSHLCLSHSLSLLLPLFQGIVLKVRTHYLTWHVPACSREHTVQIRNNSSETISNHSLQGLKAMNHTPRSSQ